MLIGSFTHTVGDKRRRVVDYEPFLDPGRNSISSVSVTTTAAGVTISGATVLEGKKVEFYVAGVTLNEVFTVTVQITCRNTEIVTDTIQFTGVAP